MWFAYDHHWPNQLIEFEWKNAINQLKCRYSIVLGTNLFAHIQKNQLFGTKHQAT